MDWNLPKIEANEGLVLCRFITAESIQEIVGMFSCEIDNTIVNFIRKIKYDLCGCREDGCEDCLFDEEYHDNELQEYIDEKLKLRLSISQTDPDIEGEYLVLIFADDVSLVQPFLKVFLEEQVFYVLRQGSYFWHKDNNLRISECVFKSTSEPDPRPASVFFEYCRKD